MFGWKKAGRLHRNSEMSGAMNGVSFATRGFAAGTKIASNLGWRAVDAMAPGDMVYTFDNDMQPVIDVCRETHWIDADFVPVNHWPILVPANALGNQNSMLLMADQGIVLESDLADDEFDDPFAIIRAKDLVGLRGIDRQAPKTPIDVVTLVFAKEQVIYAQGGALVHCPKSTTIVSDLMSGQGPQYTELPRQLAALVVDEIQAEDALSARLLA
ncbi:Hint domain-containing protein [Pseudophaeobacter sp.]|uniref:Hint domain-containing protein n=1 Tax=Pseudophaeobacter sp. TaxID=1971739 RepID=UPI00329869A4